MSILIKGMEMPTSCEACRFHDGWCLLLPGIAQARNERREDCPLVPIPPHGDLIDMNAKIDVYDRYDDDIIRPTTVRGLINEYISGGYPRTIIPAEEGE